MSDSGATDIEQTGGRNWTTDTTFNCHWKNTGVGIGRKYLAFKVVTMHTHFFENYKSGVYYGQIFRMMTWQPPIKRKSFSRYTRERVWQICGSRPQLVYERNYKKCFHVLRHNSLFYNDFLWGKTAIDKNRVKNDKISTPVWLI